MEDEEPVERQRFFLLPTAALLETIMKGEREAKGKARRLPPGSRVAVLILFLVSTQSSAAVPGGEPGDSLRSPGCETATLPTAVHALLERLSGSQCCPNNILSY